MLVKGLISLVIGDVQDILNTVTLAKTKLDNNDNNMHTLLWSYTDDSDIFCTFCDTLHLSLDTTGKM